MPADEALGPEGDHHLELVVEVDQLLAVGLHAGAGFHASQVDDRQLFETERAQVVLDACPQLLGPLRQPHRVRPAEVGVSPDLGDHDRVTGVERFAEDVVDEPVTVELCGVDVVDTQLDRTPDQGDRRLTVSAKAFELQGA